MRVVVDKDVFAKALKLVSSFNDIAMWEVTEDKMKTKVIDLAGAAMAEVEILIVGADGTGTFVVDVDTLAKRVSKLSAKELEIEIGDGTITLKGGKAKYKGSLINEDVVRKAKELKLDLNVTITLLGNDFKDIVAVAKDMGDTITLSGGRMLVKSDTENFELDVEGQGEGEATYSVEWFDVIAKVVEKADVVEIDYATNKPCRITVANDEIVARVYVAPRIENDY